MTLVYDHAGVALYCGDSRAVLAELPRKSVRCCVTSPPYFGLRDYGGLSLQIGLESTVNDYVAQLVAVFTAVREVLTDDGTLWLNLGDSYASSHADQVSDGKNRRVGAQIKRPPMGDAKAKNLLGIPWRVAFALQDDGWYLRSDIIWAKPNPMPESVRDRPTRSHEYIFLLSKRAKYYYDADAIREPISETSHTWKTDQAGKKDIARADEFQVKPQVWRDYRPEDRNKRDVWTVASAPYPEAHFATFPPALITPCILAGSAPGDTVLDPFSGSGTTAMVAKHLGRHAVGIELNPAYCDLAAKRLQQDVLPLEVPA